VGDNTNPWWVVLASGALSAVGLWLNARGSWLSTIASSQDRRDEREATERANVMNSLDARQSAWIARQDQELEKVRGRVEELELERDRAWELTRAWHALAHELRHEINASRQVANSRPGVPPITWRPIPPLPGLDEIEH